MSDQDILQEGGTQGILKIQSGPRDHGAESHTSLMKLLQNQGSKFAEFYLSYVLLQFPDAF